MKIRMWSRGMLAALPLLAGCGNFWQAPSGTTTSTTTTTTLSSGIFYLLNSGTGTIAEMSINSGQLTAVATITPPAAPQALAMAPNGLFLYVSTLNGIYLYTISSSGALTLGNANGTLSGDQATAMAVDANSHWLIEVVSGVAKVNAIAIDPTTGLLASSSEQEQSIPLPASTVKQLALSDDSSACTDCYVFVAMGTGGTAVVPFTPGNAAPLGTAQGFRVRNTGGGDNAIAVDPQNRLLYVGEADALPSATQSAGLRVFSISSTGTSELANSPYSTGGTGPSFLLASADGNYLYVANQSVSGSTTGNIASYSVATTGLTSIAQAAAGTTPLGISFESDGNFLLAVNEGGTPDLEAYTISSGTLTSVLTGATGTGTVESSAIVAAP